MGMRGTNASATVSNDLADQRDQTSKIDGEMVGWSGMAVERLETTRERERERG